MSARAPDSGLRDRYPGPRAFTNDPTDRRLFFGRSEEIESLTHRVRASRLLVLFGKSGLGKTSLLQAGLYHQLAGYDFLPIPVRFDQSDADPAAAVIEATMSASREHGIDVVTGSRENLWTFFRTTDLWRDGILLTPALVLDQFEEVFTLRDAEFRRSLAAELKDLARRRLPSAARRQQAEGGRRLSGVLPLRLVISLREEYLGALEELAAEVPEILETRFRLLPLDEERARRAIEGPAASDAEDTFGSEPFSYAEPTLEAMLKRLANRRGEYEPFQLQVLCQSVERRVIEQQASQQKPIRVDARLLPVEAMSRVLDNFYRDSLRSIGSWRERRLARGLCERGLLSPDDKRVSLEENGLMRAFKLKPATLARLVDTRLVRKDTRPGLDGFYYELSHDSLIEPVRKERDRQARTFRALAFVPSVLLVFLALAIWESFYWANTHGQPLEALSTRWASWFGKDVPVPTLVEIPRGSFLMGAATGSAGEGDAREVTIADSFYLGATEITFPEYEAFARATGRNVPSDAGWGQDDRPVINVDWDEANAYARWLGAMSGTSCRLPSETEWEYACLAGKQKPFSLPVGEGGSEDIRGRNLANCRDCGSHWDNQKTAPVKQFEANAWGLHDIHGNVAEWVSDCWDEPAEETEEGLQAGDKPCIIRVLRGGSFLSASMSTRCAHRVADQPGQRSSVAGFRVFCATPIGD